jgi:hypothetical protein
LNALEARIRAATMAIAEEIAPGSIRPLELNQGSERLAAARRVFAGARWSIRCVPASRPRPKLRVRRRLAAIAAATAVIGAGAALAAAALLPGGAGRPAGPGAHARLTAWSVTKGPGNTVTVEINQLSDPAGLQATLRSDGVPATVAFEGGTLGDTPPRPQDCHLPAMSPQADSHLQGEILGLTRPGSLGKPAGRAEFRVRPRPGAAFTRRPVNVYVSRSNAPARDGVALTIHAAEIPKGIGLNLTVQESQGGGSWGWSLGLVVASPQCTGS